MEKLGFKSKQLPVFFLIGKKWIYLERYTFHRQNEVHLKRLEQPGRNTFHSVGHLRR